MGEVYARLATGLGWSYRTIDRMTLPEVYGLFEYWRDFPPVHELMRWQTGWEKPLTTEEKIGQGALGPEDFLAHYQKTGGKLPN